MKCYFLCRLLYRWNNKDEYLSSSPEGSDEEEYVSTFGNAKKESPAIEEIEQEDEHDEEGML